MLMVVFGAGASYDSCPTYPPGTSVPGASEKAARNEWYRLPLANQLFENRPFFAEAIERFPDCQPVVPRLRSLAGETLESALEDLQLKAGTYPRGRRQLAAVRCYLHRVVTGCENGWREIAKGVTNYKSLLDHIERTQPKHPVCLVTFNYDTLLEDALRHFGLPITTIDDYTKKHPFYRVFKLHGSTSWAREVETHARIEMGPDPDKVLAQLLEHWDEVRITESYVVRPHDPAGENSRLPMFPAIAIPVEKKSRFECPQGMLEELTALLPRVSRMLVIGWRATEDHFLAMLYKHLSWGRRVDFTIVAGSQKDAEDVKVRIQKALGNAPFTFRPESTGFTEFIHSRRADQILAG